MDGVETTRHIRQTIDKALPNVILSSYDWPEVEEEAREAGADAFDIVGATCDICANGRLVVEAFERSLPGQYQLILMDVQMPVMNGYEATRMIRKLPHPMAAEIPIIAMTANAFAEDIRDALEAGMNAHVVKPIDMAVLERTVRAVLEGQTNHD